MNIEPFPKNQKLAAPVRLRPYSADLPAIAKYAKREGLPTDEAKRRLLHIAAQVVQYFLESDPNGNRSRSDSLVFLNQPAA